MLTGDLARGRRVQSSEGERSTLEHTAKRCLWRHSEQGRSQLLPVGHSTWLWGAQAQQEQRGQHRTQAFILRVLLT